MQRREFIAGASAAAIAPRAARGQPAALPVIVLVQGGSTDSAYVPAFRKGLGETGYIEGRSVTIEYRYLEGQFDRLPALMADVVRRRVAAIASFGSPLVPIEAKRATATIPIVFGVAEDPVKVGLVASLARPGGNATGMNFFNGELAAKRLGLLHELLPKATRIAVLTNPRDKFQAEATMEGVQEAARTLRMQIQTLNASTIAEIDEAFATLARDRPDAAFVSPDMFFANRRVQLATLAARDRIPTSFADRVYVEAGGLTSYGSDFANMARQVGIYVGTILKGAKPADLPVQQSTRFQFVVNLGTARALGIEVPPMLLALTDEVIE